ncbi:MAG: recombinase family protein [Candidatus Pacebacteria bacterium]|nr:recombinase family protein [Candidatus Paceibacterota bacterium]
MQHAGKQIKKATTAVAYIRESTEEQDNGFSPQNQERMIREYAKRNEIEIVEVYKDLISGTSASKRNDFQRMMADAKHTRFDVILVYHTSRFARNVKDARDNKEYLREKLGIDVVSVTQPFGDWNLPTAFLNEGVNELFDAYYSKQLSAWVRGSLMEKRKQGLQLGHPPFGYYKKKIGFDKDKQRAIYDKKWRIDQSGAKIVNTIFKMYATGHHSLADIAEVINKTGAKTKTGNPFTYSSIKDILGNRTYLGYVYSPRRGYPEILGAHPPLVSEELFDKVQQKINERRGNYGRPVAQHRFYLLQGVIFCWSCRKHLNKKTDNPHAKLLPKMYCETGTARGKELKFYGCKFRREYRACKQQNVACSFIDKQVLQFMEGFTLPDDIAPKIMKKLETSINNYSGISQLQQTIESLEKKKKRLNTMYFEVGSIPDEDFKIEMQAIETELKKYRNKPTTNVDIERMKREFLQKKEKQLKDFRSFWKDTKDEEEKRAWIQMTIRRVWVQGKKVVAIEPHDEYKDLFKAHREVLVHPPLATPFGVFLFYQQIHYSPHPCHIHPINSFFRKRGSGLYGNTMLSPETIKQVGQRAIVSFYEASLISHRIKCIRHRCPVRTSLICGIRRTIEKPGINVFIFEYAHRLFNLFHNVFVSLRIRKSIPIRARVHNIIVLMKINHSAHLLERNMFELGVESRGFFWQNYRKLRCG